MSISTSVPVAIPFNKHFLSVEEGASWLGVGRSLFYELMGAGKFRTVRLGGRRLVDAASLAQFAASLPDVERGE